MYALFALCFTPVSAAWFIEPSHVVPITASPKTLAKYTGIVSLGGSGFVQVGDAGFGGGEEGAWGVVVVGQPRPLEIHSDVPRGWKVEFVEELSN